MAAKIEPTYSRDRTILHECVPLDSPFTITIEPTTHCNLHCNYCAHSCSIEENEKKGQIFGFMDEIIIYKIADQIKDFPSRIRRFNIAGAGEPLLHKNISGFIKIIKQTGAVDKISVITNGTLFNPGLVEEIIDSGIDIIKISLQGLTADDYIKNCRTNIDFDSFLSNLDFLYNHKGNGCKIYLKIPQNYLNKETEGIFYKTFGNMCDFISTERIGNIFKEIDDEKKNAFIFNPNRYGLLEAVEQKVCPMMFYTMSILHNGDVSICPYFFRSNAVLLERYNLRTYTLSQIWNSDERNEYLLKNLHLNWKGSRKKCFGCTLLTSFSFPEDRLDGHEKDIEIKLASRELYYGPN